MAPSTAANAAASSPPLQPAPAQKQAQASKPKSTTADAPLPQRKPLSSRPNSVIGLLRIPLPKRIRSFSSSSSVRSASLRSPGSPFSPALSGPLSAPILDKEEDPMLRPTPPPPPPIAPSPGDRRRATDGARTAVSFVVTSKRSSYLGPAARAPLACADGSKASATPPVDMAAAKSTFADTLSTSPDSCSAVLSDPSCESQTTITKTLVGQRHRDRGRDSALSSSAASSSSAFSLPLTDRSTSLTRSRSNSRSLSGAGSTMKGTQESDWTGSWSSLEEAAATATVAIGAATSPLKGHDDDGPGHHAGVVPANAAGTAAWRHAPSPSSASTISAATVATTTTMPPPLLSAAFLTPTPSAEPSPSPFFTPLPSTTPLLAPFPLSQPVDPHNDGEAGGGHAHPPVLVDGRQGRCAQEREAAGDDDVGASLPASLATHSASHPSFPSSSSTSHSSSDRAPTLLRTASLDAVLLPLPPTSKNELLDLADPPPPPPNTSSPSSSAVPRLEEADGKGRMEIDGRMNGMAARPVLGVGVEETMTAAAAKRVLGVGVEETMTAAAAKRVLGVGAEATTTTTTTEKEAAADSAPRDDVLGLLGSPLQQPFAAPSRPPVSPPHHLSAARALSSLTLASTSPDHHPVAPPPEPTAHDAALCDASCLCLGCLRTSVAPLEALERWSVKVVVDAERERQAEAVAVAVAADI